MHFRANFSAESFDLKSLSKKIWHFLIEISKNLKNLKLMKILILKIAKKIQLKLIIQVNLNHFQCEPS